MKKLFVLIGTPFQTFFNCHGMNQLSKFHLIITEHLLMNPSLKTTLFTEQLTERFKKTHWEQKNYTLEHFVLQISRQCLFTKCYKSRFLKKIYRRLFYEITSEKCLTFNKLFYFESTTNKTESDTFRSEKTFFFFDRNGFSFPF